VYRDEDIIAFHDTMPQAPTHILVVPTRHIESAFALTNADRDLSGRLLTEAVRLAEQAGLSAGYRLVINTGRYGGQSVDHLHVHILGGRQMKWPPG
jgi:histidine triad (HIT) family protein